MRRSSLKSVQIKSRDPRLRSMKQFGGVLLKKSHAKTARPISTKHAMHVVLRSSQARGEWSLRRFDNRKIVNQILRGQARRFGVRVLELAHASDHIQMNIRIKNRESFNAFLRSISGMIAMKITGAAKNRTLANRFWDFRPWTRIVEFLKAISIPDEKWIQDHLLIAGAILQMPRCFHDNFTEAPA